MKLRRPRGMAVGMGLVLAVLAAGGCGGHGGGGPSTPSVTDPQVTNLQIRPLTPEKANTQVQYQITATVTDPDGDLIGGQVEVSDAAKTLTTPIDATVLRGDTISVVLVTNPVPPGSYSGTFDVTDAAGHRSNVVPFTVNIAAEGRAEIPASRAAGSFVGRLAGR